MGKNTPLINNTNIGDSPDISISVQNSVNKIKQRNKEENTQKKIYLGFNPGKEGRLFHLIRKEQKKKKRRNNEKEEKVI